MTNKGKDAKPQEKRYTYEEYRRTFRVNTEPELPTADPQIFGAWLAKEALNKIKQDARQK